MVHVRVLRTRLRKSDPAASVHGAEFFHGIWKTVQSPDENDRP